MTALDWTKTPYAWTGVAPGYARSVSSEVSFAHGFEAVQRHLYEMQVQFEAAFEFRLYAPALERKLPFARKRPPACRNHVRRPAAFALQSRNLDWGDGNPDTPRPLCRSCTTFVIAFTRIPVHFAPDCPDDIRDLLRQALRRAAP